MRDVGSSKRLYQRASTFITGGVQSGFRYTEPHPLYFSKAKGPYLWDLDGNKYVDDLVNMGACILGHGNPKVTQAVIRQLGSGLTSALDTELTVDVADTLRGMIPSAEIVKFTNTGTEAVMHAIQIARGYSGKNKIAKLEGGYNGWYDYMSISTHPKLEDTGPASDPVAVPASAGIEEDARLKTVVIPFNDFDNTSRIMRVHKDELAAVIMEPVMFNIGCVPPQNDYLKAVRELTQELGIILIFDEVITGFRLAPGGAQEYFHVIPDISTFGKAIANGFPLAAVVGKREFMSVTDPRTGKVAFAGTYNGNQIGIAASRATLNQLKNGRIQEDFQEYGKWFKKEFASIANVIGIEAKLATLAGQFQVYFTHEEPTNYRTAIKTDNRKYAAYYRAVLDSGVLIHPSATFHHGISAAHTRTDLRAVLQAMKKGLHAAKGT